MARNERTWTRGVLLLVLVTLPTPALAQRLFDVRAHGASGRKSDKATAAIQRAIDAAAAGGGGTVYFPPGDYLSGTVVLKSHVTLHLEAGATWWASRDAADYKPVSAADQANAALILAEGARHIALRGKGKIHGQAQRVYGDAGAPDSFIAKEIEIARRAGVELKRYRHVPPVVRGLYIRRSSDITIEDITIEEMQAWLLHIEASERIFVRGVRLASSLEAGINADGLDIDGCRDVVVSDVVIETGDDAIVLKSSRYGGAARPTENVTISNCVVTSTSAGLKIGTETFGDFRHITFDNCVVRNSNRGLAIIVRDGATVENVLFSDITVETNRKHWNWWGNGDPIWLVVLKRSESSKVGLIRNVVFDNVVAHGQGTSKLEGFAGRPLEEISLRNVRLHMQPEGKPDKRATHALEAKGVRGLTLEGLDVRWSTETPEPQWGSALSLSDVEDLRLTRFRGRQGLLTADAAAVSLRDVRDAIVREVESTPGTKTLLEIAGAASRNIQIRELDLLGRATRALLRRPEVPRAAVRVR